MASPTTINKLLFVATTFASIFVNDFTLANLPRPRGVPVTKASLYYPIHETKWQCLDGSKMLRFLQINDDYCDCLDGSDEPGTSACPNGVFHCANIGHSAKEISTSRVDDGVCDCCDGSDEAGTVQCPNACLEMGKAEQEKMQALAKLLKKGSTKRRDMITKGKQIKAERMARKAELEKRRNEHNSVKQEKETLKKAAEAAEAEALEFYKEMQREKDAVATEEAKIAENPQAMRVEAEQVFLRYDTNKDGFVEVTELQVDMTLDRDRNGVVTVEEAKYFLDERDRMDFENFLTLSWPRIKPIQMLAEGLFKPPQNADAIGDITDEQADLRKHSDHHDDHPHDGEEGFDGEEEEEEPYEDEEIDTGVGTATVETTPPPEYDAETQRLIDIANQARNAVSQIESELRELDQEIKELDEHNGRDYGTEDEFVTLDGECFDYEDREYIYTFCPYIRATQKPKNGGSETTLGRWDSWLVEGNTTYVKQKYSHGASCWNGPQRSVIVQFNCALENRITAVSEPNRCEYFYEFDTPAACKEAYLPAKEEKHDEL